MHNILAQVIFLLLNGKNNWYNPMFYSGNIAQVCTRCICSKPNAKGFPSMQSQNKRRQNHTGQELEHQFHIQFSEMTNNNSGADSKLSRRQWVILNSWPREYITWGFGWVFFLDNSQVTDFTRPVQNTGQVDSIHSKNDPYPKFWWLFRFCHLSLFPDYFIGLMAF